MYQEIISPERSSWLRKNGGKILKITLDSENLKNLLIVNDNKFLTKNIKPSDLIVAPKSFYMIINKKSTKINLQYSEDISGHEVVYNPFKYEDTKKEIFNPELFNPPKGYIDILAKWYSIKFTYPNYNLIYIKPEIGLSIQIHSKRSERWEILAGKPIIINGDTVSYFVENGKKFVNGIGVYHSVINPNTDPNAFVVIREDWSGKFDEEDIIRVFNPNDYF